jgi:ribosomal protein S27AE
MENNKNIGGKIYKIVNDITPDVYIGSTTRKYLSQRMGQHRQSAIKHLESKFYKFMNELGIAHFKIVLICNVDCKTREELKAVEEYYRKKENASLNSFHCHTELKGKEYKKQYRIEHADEIKSYKTQYYNDNKEKLNEKLTCNVCGDEFTAQHKQRHEKSKNHIKFIKK